MLDTLNAFVDGLLDKLTKAGILIAGVFALYQFMDAKQDARVQRTSEYITRYEEGTPAAALRRINAALRPYAPQFEKLTGEDGLSAATRKDMVLTLFDHSPTLAEDVDAIVGFYKGLDACVRQLLCDRTTAVTYFGPEASEFYSNFEPYFGVRHVSDPAFASSVVLFARLELPQPGVRLPFSQND
jgi:hypothetical protein